MQCWKHDKYRPINIYKCTQFIFLVPNNNIPKRAESFEYIFILFIQSLYINRKTYCVYELLGAVYNFVQNVTRIYAAHIISMLNNHPFVMASTP